MGFLARSKFKMQSLHYFVLREVTKTIIIVASKHFRRPRRLIVMLSAILCATTHSASCCPLRSTLSLNHVTHMSHPPKTFLGCKKRLVFYPGTRLVFDVYHYLRTIVLSDFYHIECISAGFQLTGSTLAEFHEAFCAACLLQMHMDSLFIPNVYGLPCLFQIQL